jgi:predicted negative regulator of RcsB-dependent stress response
MSFEQLMADVRFANAHQMINKSGLANVLLVKLKVAKAEYEKGNIDVALNQLEIFSKLMQNSLEKGMTQEGYDFLFDEYTALLKVI